jgi:hypothetical protein
VDQQIFKIRIKLAKSLPGAKHLLDQSQNESLFLFGATTVTPVTKNNNEVSKAARFRIKT